MGWFFILLIIGGYFFFSNAWTNGSSESAAKQYYHMDDKFEERIRNVIRTNYRELEEFDYRSESSSRGGSYADIKAYIVHDIDLALKRTVNMMNGKPRNIFEHPDGSISKLSDKRGEQFKMGYSTYRYPLPDIPTLDGYNLLKIRNDMWQTGMYGAKILDAAEVIVYKRVYQNGYRYAGTDRTRNSYNSGWALKMKPSRYLGNEEYMVYEDPYKIKLNYREHIIGSDTLIPATTINGMDENEELELQLREKIEKIVQGANICDPQIGIVMGLNYDKILDSIFMIAFNADKLDCELGHLSEYGTPLEGMTIKEVIDTAIDVIVEYNMNQEGYSLVKNNRRDLIDFAKYYTPYYKLTGYKERNEWLESSIYGIAEIMWLPSIEKNMKIVYG